MPFSWSKKEMKGIKERKDKKEKGKSHSLKSALHVCHRVCAWYPRRSDEGIGFPGAVNVDGSDL